MKRNKKAILLTLSVLLFAVLFGLNSCGKKNNNNNEVVIWSPDPVNGELPPSVLPEELKDEVGQYITIFSGDDPVKTDGQFVSKPHMLLHSSVVTDTIQVYNDRYICFVVNNNGSVDFYGKQWDNTYNKYYEEVYRNLKRVGEDDNFTCYYLTEAYPNGMYALQSTIFSGKWNPSYGGLKDFQVAVILLETSGNPNLAPNNSYRVLGDGDGLAKDTAWLAKKNFMDDGVMINEYDPFWMFRVK